MPGPPQAKARTKRSDGFETEARIMLAAERLFAHRGLAGVTLAEIGAAAGQANKAAVRYHFGTKEDLAQQVLRTRYSQMELWRQAELERAERDGKDRDARTLINIFFGAPLVIEEDGERIFARFLLRFITGLENWGDVHHPLAGTGPSTGRQILSRIDRCIGEHAMDRLSLRAACLVLGSVVDWENRTARNPRLGGLDETITTSLEMISDAFEGYRRLHGSGIGYIPPR